MRINIITPFYNVEKWISKNIEMLKQQTHTDFRCVLVDDLSTDKSFDVCRDIINNDQRFILIKNKEKKYALKNIIDSINILGLSDEEIIVTIDGDDWLYDKFVLEKVNKIYEIKKILLTYGNYLNYPTNTLGHCSPYPKHVIDNNSYRQDNWRASHLRTFKYKLWKNIKQEDFLDEEAKFLDVTWDLAFMFPMLEMSGGKFHCFREPLYVYNRQNDINDYKIKLQRQRFYETYIRRKNRYERLF